MLASNAADVAQASDGIIHNDSAGKQYDPAQSCSECPQQAGVIQMQTGVKCCLLGPAHKEVDEPGAYEDPEAERQQPIPPANQGRYLPGLDAGRHSGRR